MSVSTSLRTSPQQGPNPSPPDRDIIAARNVARPDRPLAGVRMASADYPVPKQRAERAYHSFPNVQPEALAAESSQHSAALLQRLFSADDLLPLNDTDLSKVREAFAQGGREEHVRNAVAARLQSNPPTIKGVLVRREEIITATRAVRAASDKFLTMKPRATRGDRNVKTADASALVENRLPGHGLQQGLQRVGTGIRNAVASMIQTVGLSGRNAATAVHVVPERPPLAAANETIV